MKKLKLIITLFLVTVILSCNSGKKEQQKQKKDAEPKQKELADFNFPKGENDLKNPNLFNLTYDKHAFTPELVFREVNALEVEKDIYNIILVVDEETTNFDELVKWKVGMYLYPVNPDEFENETDRKKGMKSIGTEAKPVMMGEEAVVVYKNLKLKPKNFEHIRFYLYNKKEETNLNYYRIRDIDFI